VFLSVRFREICDSEFGLGKFPRNNKPMKPVSFLLVLFWALSAAAAPGKVVGAPTATTLFVAANGDDSNPGTILEPLASVTNAVTIAPDGTVIQVGPGTFYINQLRPAANVTISGSGRTITKLFAMNIGPDTADDVAWILLTNGTYLKDFYLTKAVTNWAKMYPLRTKSDATNIVLENIHVVGDSDWMSAGAGSFGKAINCRFSTRWDGFTTSDPSLATNGRWDFFNCDIFASNDPEANAFNDGTIDGFTQSAGTVNIYGGSIVISNILHAGDIAVGAEGCNLSGVSIQLPNDHSGGASFYAADCNIFGHPYAESSVIDCKFYGDTTNDFIAGAVISVRKTGERFWTKDAAGLTNATAGSFWTTTNTAPVNTTIVRCWVNVTNKNDGQIYKMPLYR
jgi:hypothetical protein